MLNVYSTFILCFLLLLAPNLSMAGCPLDDKQYPTGTTFSGFICSSDGSWKNMKLKKDTEKCHCFHNGKLFPLGSRIKSLSCINGKWLLVRDPNQLEQLEKQNLQFKRQISLLKNQNENLKRQVKYLESEKKQAK